MALAAAAILLVTTGVWASPWWGGLSSNAYAIARVHWAIFHDWLWLIAAAGGLIGAAVMFGYLCRKTKSPFFRDNDPMFRLFRFFCFLLAAAVIGGMLFYVLAVMAHPSLVHIMQIYAKMSGDYSYFSHPDRLW